MLPLPRIIIISTHSDGLDHMIFRISILPVRKSAAYAVRRVSYYHRRIEVLVSRPNLLHD